MNLTLNLAQQTDNNNDYDNDDDDDDNNDDGTSQSVSLASCHKETRYSTNRYESISLFVCQPPNTFAHVGGLDGTERPAILCLDAHLLANASIVASPKDDSRRGVDAVIRTHVVRTQQTCKAFASAWIACQVGSIHQRLW
jgi:hypothetical protein